MKRKRSNFKHISVMRNQRVIYLFISFLYNDEFVILFYVDQFYMYNIEKCNHCITVLHNCEVPENICFHNKINSTHYLPLYMNSEKNVPSHTNLHQRKVNIKQYFITFLFVDSSRYFHSITLSPKEEQHFYHSCLNYILDYNFALFVCVHNDQS